MVSPSKILTVSYGTFSCTLEGFDDSFDTMKAIAEYFRDLAADDRYFGAEPPTPDAEMLARIAEREIARRVEAHEEKGKIHLRADGDAVAAASGLLATSVTESEVVDDQPAAEDSTETVANVSLFVDTPAEEVEALDASEPAPELEVSHDAFAPTESAAPKPEIEEPIPDFAETEPEIALIPEETEMAEPKQAEDIRDQVNEAEYHDETGEDEAEAPTPVLNEIVVEDEVETDLEDWADESDTDSAVSDEEDYEEPEVLYVADNIGTGLENDDNAPADDLNLSGIQLGTPDSEAYELDPEIAAFMERTKAEEIESESVADLPANEESISETTVEPIEALRSEDMDIAAKLQRIRSVTRPVEPVQETAEYNEDEHALGVVRESISDLEDILGSTHDFADQEEESVDTKDAADALEQMFAESEIEEKHETVIPEQQSIVDRFDDADELQAETSQSEEDEDLLQLLADAAADSTQDDDTSDEFFEDMSDDEESVDVDLSDITELAEAFGDAPVDASKDELVADPLILGEADRIAITEEPINLDTDAQESQLSEDLSGESTLSPEEEADLLRELAEVEAELDDVPETLDLSEAVEEDTVSQPEPLLKETSQNDDVDANEIAAEDGVSMDGTEEKPRGLKRLLGVGKRKPDEDAARIFDEADVQMEDKDATSRRNAIQHLRAAVAATRAEKKAGGQIEPDVDDSAYRSDLADVVRPRRPSSSERPSERPTRPEETRPAPLKLVAEQRVDTEQPPIRPRRISASEKLVEQDTGPEATSAFSAFAEEMGAVDLAEILEAAAAYMSDVEGRDEFSRPMLMNKLKEVTQDSYSREDGLRSFGELLRGGKIRKLRGGRFTITEETEYRAEARNVG